MKNRKINLKKSEVNLKTKEAKVSDSTFIYSGPITVSEFARKTGIDSSKIIKYFFLKGKAFNLNVTLDDEQIGEICIENNLDFKREISVSDDAYLEEMLAKDEKSELVARPCIVTVMGHVDHGKTTLIDFIRKTSVASTEAGGITQTTGAYQIEYKGEKITILDTPGHEAFAEMRLRGSKLTDIIILVVAADDGVMPQTREAISHALLAKVPIIVFVNKMDKVGGKIDKQNLFNQLSTAGLTPEEWGGDVAIVYGSAMKGTGVNDLFDSILGHAEMLELKANPDRLPSGVVVESTIDKSQGVIATLIVQNGTLRKRDFIVAGAHYGRIRQLSNHNLQPIEEATPGTPIIVTGLNYSPNPGAKFVGFHDEKFAKELADKKAETLKQSALSLRASWKTDFENTRILNIVVKTSVTGSAEAIRNALLKIKNNEVQVNIVQATAGSINKSDILLASTAHAIIFAFNVRPDTATRSFAKDQGVEIRYHSIIYKLIEEVEEIVKGMMAPKYEEKITGTAQILKVFFSSKIGNIAGSKITSGTVSANSKLRLIRDGIVVYDGVIASLHHGTDSVKQMKSGTECGIVINNFNDIKEGDVIEAYADVQIKE